MEQGRSGGRGKRGEKKKMYSSKKIKKLKNRKRQGKLNVEKSIDLSVLSKDGGIYTLVRIPEDVIELQIT